FIIILDPGSFIHFSFVSSAGGTLKEIVASVYFADTACQTAVRKEISVSGEIICVMVSSLGEIEPADEFTVDCDLLETGLLLDPAACTEVIITVARAGEANPFVLIGSAASVFYEVISVIADLNQLISLNLGISVGHIVISVCSLNHPVRKQISVCIQQIQHVAGGDHLVSSASFFHPAAVFAEVEPLCALGHPAVCPFVEEHLSGDLIFALRFREAVEACPSVAGISSFDHTHIRRSVLKQIVVVLSDTVDRICLEVF